MFFFVWAGEEASFSGCEPERGNMYNLRESGKRLKELRKKTGKTQLEVAIDLGIGVDTISKLERGIQGTSIDNVALLSEYYGTTLDYIIHGTEVNSMERISEMLKGYPEEKSEKLVHILQMIIEMNA